MNRDEYDYDDPDIDSNYRMEEIHATKKNMPVKTHIRKMEETIAELKTDLNNNKKNGQILNSELRTLEHKSKEKCNEITKSIMDDLFNFEKDFQRIKQNDKSETIFLDNQVKSLNQDSIKLKQNVISLDTRLRTCETEVGVEYY